MRSFFLCECPKSIDPVRHQFSTAMLAPTGSATFFNGMSGVCSVMQPDLQGISGHMKYLSTGSREDTDAILERIKSRRGGCLAALSVGAWACLVTAHLMGEAKKATVAVSIAVPLLLYTAECLEPGTTRWKISAGFAMRQLLGVIFDPMLDWTFTPKRPFPLCYANLQMPRDSLIGYCGRETPNRIRSSVAGPLVPIAVDDVTLCTHTSGDKLSLVEAMLLSWRGPASVAVFEDAIEEPLPRLNEWIHQLREKGLHQVVISVVAANDAARTQYDRLYPANILRQAALDAAVADLVLLAEPAFVPSAGFYAAVAKTSALGSAVRGILATTPTAFLVASFLLFEKVADELSVDELHRHIEEGVAVAFDAQVCPMCRPHAWQWALLTPQSSLRFHGADSGDLHHPMWLTSRKVLPRLPGFLHGVVKPYTEAARIGWTGLPCGLKASAEQLLAKGAQLLVLPGLFLHRQKALPIPSHNDDVIPDRFPEIFNDLLFRRFLTTLPPANQTTSRVPRSVFTAGRLVEVAPPRPAPLLTLQHGGADRSLQLFVVASTVLGSAELRRLLQGVPWPVHAVAVGAKDFWGAAKEELPRALRRLEPDALVAVVDAYDSVLLPCDRSIPEEYEALGKDIVIAAEQTCWPNADLCRSCEVRYPQGSRDLAACRAFPHLNSGGFLGRAAALADAFDWMREQGAAIGRDDQENAMHYYNRFPDRVALDHRQRIWSVLLFCDPARFRIEGCSVISDYIQGPICFAHGNGGAMHELLDPLLGQLADRGCRPRPRDRKVSAYAGLSAPTPMVDPSLFD